MRIVPFGERWTVLNANAVGVALCDGVSEKVNVPAIAEVTMHPVSASVAVGQDPVVNTFGIERKVLHRIIPFIDEVHKGLWMGRRADFLDRIGDMRLFLVVSVDPFVAKSALQGQSYWRHRPNSWENPPSSAGSSRN